jgi:hypothetical protein
VVVVSVAKLERRSFFSWYEGKSKEHSSKIFAARQLAEGGSASRKTMRISQPKAQIIRLRRRPGKLRTNALSVKLRGSHAPLRRTTRSTTCPAPATDEAEEWGEVSVPDQSLALE